MKKQKSKNFFVIFLCAIILTSVVFLLVKNLEKNKESTFGVWWWDDELDTEQYLSFAIYNDINEIYYCTGNFDENTKNFISKANSRDMDVYWLVGEYTWLDNPNNLLSNIEKYLTYQSLYSDSQFKGIHLDIEPHQNPNFAANRDQLIYNLIDLAYTLKDRYPTIKFDYDLPFWLEDEITFNNFAKPAYEHMIDIANRVFIMSYRDTASSILNIAKEEIFYANKQNKQLVLCVETYSTEGDNVSFFEEGKQIMEKEINKLKQEIPKSFGISIHHIKTWYDLKE